MVFLVAWRVPALCSKDIHEKLGRSQVFVNCEREGCMKKTGLKFTLRWSQDEQVHLAEKIVCAQAQVWKLMRHTLVGNCDNWFPMNRALTFRTRLMSARLFIKHLYPTWKDTASF